MEQHIRHNKPTGMTNGEKIRSWNAIEQGLPMQSSPFSYSAFLRSAQNKIVAGVVGVLILGGGAATAYASNAKPGDVLFPVAIAKEKAQILFAGSTEKKKALQVRFAQKRLAEVRELASLAESSEDDTISSAVATRTPALASEESTKRTDRAKHGAEVALRELHETRNLLSHDEDRDATNAVDDIISEVSEVSVHGRRGDRNTERKNGRGSHDESSTTSPSQLRDGKKGARGTETRTEARADDSGKNIGNIEVETKTDLRHVGDEKKNVEDERREEAPETTGTDDSGASNDEDR